MKAINVVHLFLSPREAWNHFAAWWTRGLFKAKDKQQFFSALRLTLSVGVQLPAALAGLRDAFDTGRKWKRHIIAIVAQECLQQISAGKSLGDAMRGWLADDECSLLDAGAEAGDMLSAFDRVLMVVDAKQRAIKAAVGTAAYPAALLLMSGFILNKVSVELVPKLLRGKTADDLEGEAWLLKIVADYVSGYGAITLACLALLVVAIVLSLPVLRGNVRYYLDKLPPWSFYRMLYGSTFFLNIGVQMQAGIKLSRVLSEAADRANPWLKERLSATLYGVNNGKTLGQALADAGYDFPDRQIIHFLCAITAHKGSEEHIEALGAQWLNDSIERLKRIAALLSIFALMVNAAIILLTFAGISGMEDVLTNSLDR